MKTNLTLGTQGSGRWRLYIMLSVSSKSTLSLEKLPGLLNQVQLISSIQIKNYYLIWIVSFKQNVIDFKSNYFILEMLNCTDKIVNCSIITLHSFPPPLFALCKFYCNLLCLDLCAHSCKTKTGVNFLTCNQLFVFSPLILEKVSLSKERKSYFQ